MHARTQHPIVSAWLWTVYGLTAVMVVIGGITRLTGSGLSMVEWRPLMGALPPFSDAEWHRVFDAYKQFPQYQQVNEWMTLADFKRIFFWEYLHRLLGRLIGIVFLVPYLWFLLRGSLARTPKGRIFAAFVFGGLQGLLGWFMVKSGLVDDPRVSHFRLAAHLMLAFFVAHWIMWIALDLRGTVRDASPRNALRFVWATLGLVVVQVMYGAFMAGSRAGFMYRTFPDMNGEFFPSALSGAGMKEMLLTSPMGIHFMHRLLAWITLVVVMVLVVYLWRNARAVRRPTTALGAVVATQFLFGVLTVMNGVPTQLAVVHQAGGFFTVSALVYLAHAVRPRPVSDNR